MRSDILLLRSSRRLLTVLSILVEVRMGAVGAPRPSGPPALLDPWGSLGLCGAFTRQRKHHFFGAGNFLFKGPGQCGRGVKGLAPTSCTPAADQSPSTSFERGPTWDCDQEP